MKTVDPKLDFFFKHIWKYSFCTYRFPMHFYIARGSQGDKTALYYFLVAKASSYPQNRAGTWIKGRQEPESISNELKSPFVFHLAIKSCLMFKNANVAYLKAKIVCVTPTSCINPSGLGKLMFCFKQSWSYSCYFTLSIASTLTLSSVCKHTINLPCTVPIEGKELFKAMRRIHFHSLGLFTSK